MAKQNIVVMYSLICIALFVGLMYWTNRLFVNNYIKETFTDGKTHTVDLPLTTVTSCQNMCGPPGRCSITGTQCLSDIDCYGCQPNTSPDLSNTFLKKNKIYGYSESGKSSYLSPTYSSLVHDIGTQAKPLNNKSYSNPPRDNWGVDIWTSKSAEMRKIHDKTYRPPTNTMFMPLYPSRPSVTGEFRSRGPFASNATLAES